MRWVNDLTGREFDGRFLSDGGVYLVPICVIGSNAIITCAIGIKSIWHFKIIKLSLMSGLYLIVEAETVDLVHSALSFHLIAVRRLLRAW
jgi:hypothetical protein